MPNRELSVVVMPSGTLQTEWIETKETIKQSSRLLQEEIFNRFVADADTGLLFLSFCDKKVALSPSLEYWRDFAGLFTQELSRTPELELFRHKTNIAVDKHQLVHFANSAPLMPGSEHISAELLKTVWSKLNAAFQHCEPPITVVQESLDVGGKTVIVVNIPKGDQRPYRTNSSLYYIRTTSGCRQASREELLRHFQSTESLYYDETALPRLSLSDLDIGAFENFLEETGQTDLGVDQKRLLKNWRLISGNHPTIAGIILFGRKPQQHLPYVQVNAARIPGIDVSVEPSDMKDITGRLLDVIDQVQRFLKLHLPVPHEIKGFSPEGKRNTSGKNSGYVAIATGYWDRPR